MDREKLRQALRQNWRNYYIQLLESHKQQDPRSHANLERPTLLESQSDQCGAMTRRGKPCRHTTLYANQRCKFHGGLSTGPITQSGKEQSRINGRKGGRPRKLQK